MKKICFVISLLVAGPSFAQATTMEDKIARMEARITHMRDICATIDEKAAAMQEKIDAAKNRPVKPVKPAPGGTE
jgi:hypothetical protein